MTTEKALAIIPRSLDEISSLAERFAKSALIPADLRNKAPDVFVTLLAGQELGLSPMASLRSIHVVKGKPTLSADAMVALCLASGACDYFRPTQKTAESVTYEKRRKGGDDSVSLTWTLDDAKRAGLLGGDNWTKYPRAMLSARCKAELARDVYPDVLAGVYETSKAGEIRDRTAPVDYIDAEVVETKPDFDLDGAIIAIREAETDADLRRIAATFTDAPASARESISQAYKARKEQLRAAKAAPIDTVASDVAA